MFLIFQVIQGVNIANSDFLQKKTTGSGKTSDGRGSDDVKMEENAIQDVDSNELQVI